jgi:predicted TIM-barrel fold metal-dependent hydrolase
MVYEESDRDMLVAMPPDMNFVIYHVGLPFLDETCWQLIRCPNLYASLAATVDFLVRSPIFRPRWALRAREDVGRSR